ncbi:hypothetical protein ACSVDA_03475 [Cytobacillus sp. Hm23]
MMFGEQIEQDAEMFKFGIFCNGILSVMAIETEYSGLNMFAIKGI